MKLYIRAAEDTKMVYLPKSRRSVPLDYGVNGIEDTEDGRYVYHGIGRIKFGYSDIDDRKILAMVTKDREILSELAEDANADVREIVARNYMTRSEDLMKLAEDEDENVRFGVVENPSTPSEIIDKLAKLSGDENYRIRYFAKKHPNKSRKTNNSSNKKLQYNIDSDDPSDWSLDYDKFFELIDNALDDLNINVENCDEDETMGGRICIYELSNGETIDSYDLETELLSDLYDGKLKDTKIYQYIKKCLKQYK